MLTFLPAHRTAEENLLSSLNIRVMYFFDISHTLRKREFIDIIRDTVCMSNNKQVSKRKGVDSLKRIDSIDSSANYNSNFL